VTPLAAVDMRPRLPLRARAGRYAEAAAVASKLYTFGTARRGLGGAAARPVPSTRPVYQLHITQCGTIIASAL